MRATVYVFLAGFITCGCGSSSSSSPTSPTSTTASVTPFIAFSGHYFLLPGQTSQLSATETLADSTHQDVTATAAWSSSNTGVATISNAGLVTATGLGSTTITATNAGVTSTLVVVVVTDLVASLSISGTTTVTSGQTTQLSAILNFKDASTQDVTGAASWSSSDQTIAVVSASGLLTAIAPGSVTIAASYMGRNATAAVTTN
jgi:hypothetical protein